jgi:hypothetical protein
MATVQDKINRLLWNRRVVILPSDIDKPKDLDYIVIHDLSLEDRNYYLLIRELEEHKARLADVPTEQQIMESARAGGYWGTVEDEIEAKADQHIAFLEAEFEAKKKFKSRQNIIKLQIEDSLAKKAWVARKRNEFKLSSAEYLAHEIASFELLRRVSFRMDSSPLFPDDTSFLLFKKEYLSLLYFLVQSVMNEGALELSDIRQIARSTEWRLIWVLSRENLPTIFNRSIGDFNINHKMVIYWSRIYDSAFESTEPPEMEIVNNDEEFDRWLANRDLDRKEEKSDKQSDAQEQWHVLDGEHVDFCSCGAKEQNKKLYLGEKVPHANDCLFGTWHQYTAEERREKAAAIYSRNSGNMRKFINNEQDKIEKHGSLEEQHLRGKKTRQMLGMKTNIIPIKRK